MDTVGNRKAAEAAQRIQSEQDRLQVIIRDLENVRNEISHYEQRKEQLEDVLRDNQPTAELQKNKEHLENSIKAEEKAMELAYSRLMSDFNTNTSAFFAKPLMNRAISFLKSAKIDDKGVPNMNSTSIDFIIERGHCICGATICEGNEVHLNLIKERNYLPPQSIGTMIRTFIDQINTYNSTNENYYTNIKMSYEDIYRYKTRIQDWAEEVDEISQKIKGKGDVKKYEEELVDVKKRLKDFNVKKR
ncbi:hypothetical protein [Cohnella kolymensis]|uniref:hypothetical protein n=1 Tax=Cohnella kolymensis TaxID=1590652 RepID=UPI000695D3DF|nr:hypothetical protein [Cohnella kolymensis]